MESGDRLPPLVIGELQEAIGQGEIVVHYQPQVDVCSGRVPGVEALVRWQHPRHGLLGPDAFVPAAEQTGPIAPLTQYVLDSVRSALRRHGLQAPSLEHEITETSAMVNPRRSIEVLGALAELGVSLSIDDYGTGQSSLAYLQKLPVDRLKIDHSFVTGMIDDPASAAIVSSTASLLPGLVERIEERLSAVLGTPWLKPTHPVG